ncbi:hypothetical protein ACFY0A_29905 [Streptomyces sp. NPDC001698]|uniref:hypothetical protein n=1 Tax=unclassified Streptomyces TaxID=2593676 RepID=UPI0036B67039
METVKIRKRSIVVVWIDPAPLGERRRRALGVPQSNPRRVAGPVWDRVLVRDQARKGFHDLFTEFGLFLRRLTVAQLL